MRFLLLLAFLFSSISCFADESNMGTLTLAGEYIIFCWHGTETKYEAMRPPGLKVIGYEKKSLVKDENEINVSELLVELTTGEHLVLVEGKPQEIVRITEGKTIKWRGLK